MPRTERPAMSSYGVPSEIEGTLPWEWAEERLERSRNFWVVTVDPVGRPHAMPVWGVWIADEERFWFSCASDSLKSRNLTVNPHVVVAAEDTVEVVSIEGTASRVSGARDAAEAWAAKYEPDPDKRPELADFMLGADVYVVVPRKAFGLIERAEDFAVRATRWVWDGGTPWTAPPVRIACRIRFRPARLRRWPAPRAGSSGAA